MPRLPKYQPVVAPALTPCPPTLFTGTSGWSYATWKPVFYPADVPSRAFLHHYAAHLTSVEVNYTFASELQPGQLEEWLAATPPGFRFTFKAPQRITHFQRLLHCEDTLTTFLAALAPARKAKKLGAVLFQFPPNFKPNHQRLADFLALPALRRYTLAFEFRHEGWFTEETYKLLRKYKAALCIAESEDLITPEVHTAPHAYFRLRMPGGYTQPEVQAFAEHFSALSATRDVYAYFKHEDEPNGVLNALHMISCANQLSRAEGGV